MMAGYSGTPLPKKLGIGAGSRVTFVSAPADFIDSLQPPPIGVNILGLEDGPFDVLVLFCRDRKALEAGFGPACLALKARGGLWVAWPKKSSGVATDLTEDLVRNFGLATGLVDNKVCAISEVWSGLRFVVRLEDREGWVHP
jgi:hypothetical protein